MYICIYVCMCIHICICINNYIYTYIYIYPIFVNGIPGALRPPDDPDLARFSVPINIAQTLAR